MSIDPQDYFAAHDLLHTLVGAVDRSDWDAWEACFSPDAHVDYSAAGGQTGTPQEVRAIEHDLGALDLVRHLVTNIRLQQETPDLLTGQAYFMSPTRGESTSSASLVGGNYAFTLTRHLGSWRFNSFTPTIEWWT